MAKEVLGVDCAQILSETAKVILLNGYQIVICLVGCIETFVVIIRHAQVAWNGSFADMLSAMSYFCCAPYGCFAGVSDGSRYWRVEPAPNRYVGANLL